MQFISYNSDDDGDDNEGCDCRGRMDDKECKQLDINRNEVEADHIPITDLDESGHTSAVLRVVFPTKWSVHDDSDDDSEDDRSNNRCLDQERTTDGSSTDGGAVVMNAMELLSSVTSTPKFLSSYHTKKAFILPTVINTPSLHEATVAVVASDGQALMKDQRHPHIKQQMAAQQMAATMGGLEEKASRYTDMKSVTFQASKMLNSKQKGLGLGTPLPPPSGTSYDKDRKETSAKVGR